MAPDTIVFALANPDPEVDPDMAARHAAVVATGRWDFANQINNVLVFPGRLPRACSTRRLARHRRRAARRGRRPGRRGPRGRAQRDLHHPQRVPPRRGQGRGGRRRGGRALGRAGRRGEPAADAAAVPHRAADRVATGTGSASPAVAPAGDVPSITAASNGLLGG